MITANSFRERFAAGEPAIGTLLLFSDADIPRLIGDTGLFDYGASCAENAAFDVERL